MRTRSLNAEYLPGEWLSSHVCIGTAIPVNLFERILFSTEMRFVFECTHVDQCGLSCSNASLWKIGTSSCYWQVDEVACLYMSSMHFAALVAIGKIQQHGSRFLHILEFLVFFLFPPTSSTLHALGASMLLMRAHML